MHNYYYLSVSSKFIDRGSNQKPVCNFLLVVSSDSVPTWHRSVMPAAVKLVFFDKHLTGMYAYSA